MPENKTYLLKGRNVPLVYTKICWQMLPQEWWFDREHFEVFVPLTRNTKLIIVRNEGRTSLLETIHDWWSDNRPTYKNTKNCVMTPILLPTIQMVESESDTIATARWLGWSYFWHKKINRANGLGQKILKSPDQKNSWKKINFTKFF